ncbi:unnamed protein product [Cochlearia groenlandica]
MEDDGGDTNSWADLPPDLTSLILSRIGAIEILENAQRVCRSWRRVCKDPWMWRKIDTHYLGGRGLRGFDLDMLCRRAINRSQGGLLEIDLWYFGDNSLLRCISDRASNLKRLKLAFCIHTTCDGLRKAVMNLPLLEDLEVSYGSMWGGEWLRAVGRSCPKMKTLKVNQMSYCYPYESDEEALAIAETMPRLVHLQLFRNTLTNVGLKAVLDNCVNLEHLDLISKNSTKSVESRSFNPSTTYIFPSTTLTRGHFRAILMLGASCQV